MRSVISEDQLHGGGSFLFSTHVCVGMRFPFELKACSPRGGLSLRCLSWATVKRENMCPLCVCVFVFTSSSTRVWWTLSLSILFVSHDGWSCVPCWWRSIEKEKHTKPMFFIYARVGFGRFDLYQYMHIWSFTMTLNFKTFINSQVHSFANADKMSELDVWKQIQLFFHYQKPAWMF